MQKVGMAKASNLRYDLKLVMARTDGFEEKTVLREDHLQSLVQIKNKKKKHEL